MSLALLMDQTGQVVRAGTDADRYNGTSLDWDSTTDTDTEYWMSGGVGSEQIVGRDALVSARTLYLPADTDVTGRDRFRDADGNVFLIDGPVKRARRPRGGVHHLEAKVRLVEG